MASLSANSLRRVIWLARLRVALRWFWPLDLIILLCALATARYGSVPAAIGMAALVGALVLAVQTACVAHSHTGKRWARIFTWKVLALMAEHALWDVTQVLTVLR
jgi:hypothetical protein